MAASSAVLQPTRTSSFRYADVDGVTGVVSRLEQAWNEYDSEKFSEEFTEDADFVNLYGRRAHGRANIALGHQASFSSNYEGSTVRLALARMRLLGEDVAVAHLSQYLHIPRGPMAGAHDFAPMLVLIRRADGWKITAFQNTPVQ